VADFAVFGALLLGVGVTFELAARKTGNIVYRSAVGVALAAAFILVWVNGSVGVIGSEDNDANLMYARAPDAGFLTFQLDQGWGEGHETETLSFGAVQYWGVGQQNVLANRTPRQPVDVRRLDQRVAVATQVAVQVIADQEQHVRPRRLCSRAMSARMEDGDG